jgi:hypothetical protein
VLKARNDRFRVDVRNALIAETVACGQRLADCGFNLAALHPAYSIKRRTSAENTGIPAFEIRTTLPPLTH